MRRHTHPHTKRALPASPPAPPLIVSVPSSIARRPPSVQGCFVMMSNYTGNWVPWSYDVIQNTWSFWPAAPLFNNLPLQDPWPRLITEHKHRYLDRFLSQNYWFHVWLWAIALSIVEWKRVVVSVLGSLPRQSCQGACPASKERWISLCKNKAD